MKPIIGMLLAWIATASLPSAVRAEDPSCFVCEAKIVAAFYRIQDRGNGGLRDVCADCAQQESRCMTCGLPVTASATRLPDGRFICSRDTRTAVLADGEVERLGNDTRRELEHLFGKSLAFPTTGVTVTGADRLELEKTFKTPGYDQICGSVFGATLTMARGRGAFAHSIRVLTGLPGGRMMAVCAHEYGHTWIRENVPAGRALAADAIEGFCEWVALRLMDAKGETNELAIIRANPYSKGQVEAFAGADRIYGTPALVAWMKHGEDERLRTNQLERVLFLRPGTIPQPAAAAGITAAPRVPDQLVLQGTATTSQRRMAMINNVAFEEGQERTVQVGENQIRIRCLKILDAAVHLRVGDNPTPIALKIAPR